MKIKLFVFIINIFCIFPLLYAQENVLSFDKNWALDVSLNYHTLQFYQSDSFVCRGNKPLDLGLEIRYKKFELGFNIELPFLYEYYYPRSESFDINTKYIGERVVTNINFSKYSSFYIDEYQDMGKEVDLDIMSTGFSVYWILDHEKHSLRGVYKLDRKQTVSSGSPLIGFGGYYNSIHSNDNKLPGYEDKQHFIYLSPLAGYSYVWIFGSGLFLNIDITVGANHGLHINERKFVLMPMAFPNMTFGYHFNTWSVNASVGANMYLAIQSFNNENIDWHQLLKINAVLLNVSKRF